MPATQHTLTATDDVGADTSDVFDIIVQEVSGLSADGVLTLGAGTGPAEIHFGWDRPITNTDASFLGDLRSFKVYVGTSTGNYNLIAGLDTFDTPQKGAIEVVVIGLTAATTYFATVTAVDAFGNESATATESSFVAIVPTAPSRSYTDITTSTTISSSGDYRLTASFTGKITITANNVYLNGNGETVTFNTDHAIELTGNRSNIEIDGVDFVHLGGFTYRTSCVYVNLEAINCSFHNNALMVRHNSSSGIRFADGGSDTSGTRIYSNSFDCNTSTLGGTSNIPSMVYEAHGCKIFNNVCSITNSGRSGMCGNGADSEAWANTVTFTAPMGQGNALAIFHGDNWYVHDNHFDGEGNPAGRLVHCDGGLNWHILHNQINPGTGQMGTSCRGIGVQAADNFAVGYNNFDSGGRSIAGAMRWGGFESGGQPVDMYAYENTCVNTPDGGFFFYEQWDGTLSTWHNSFDGVEVLGQNQTLGLWDSNDDVITGTVDADNGGAIADWNILNSFVVGQVNGATSHITFTLVWTGYDGNLDTPSAPTNITALGNSTRPANVNGRLVLNVGTGARDINPRWLRPVQNTGNTVLFSLRSYKIKVGNTSGAEDVVPEFDTYSTDIKGATELLVTGLVAGNYFVTVTPVSWFDVDGTSAVTEITATDPHTDPATVVNITAAEVTSGYTISLSDRTYRLTENVSRATGDAITINAGLDNVVFDGQGFDIAYNVSGNGYGVYFNDGSSSVRIRGVVFAPGAQAAGGAATCQNIRLDQGTYDRCEISDCTFEVTQTNQFALQALSSGGPYDFGGLRIYDSTFNQDTADANGTSANAGFMGKCANMRVHGVTRNASNSGRAPFFNDCSDFDASGNTDNIAVSNGNIGFISNWFGQGQNCHDNIINSEANAPLDRNARMFHVDGHEDAYWAHNTVNFTANVTGAHRCFSHRYATRRGIVCGNTVNVNGFTGGIAMRVGGNSNQAATEPFGPRDSVVCFNSFPNMPEDNAFHVEDEFTVMYTFNNTFGSAAGPPISTVMTNGEGGDWYSNDDTVNPGSGTDKGTTAVTSVRASTGYFINNSFTSATWNGFEGNITFVTDMWQGFDPQAEVAKAVTFQ